MMKCLDDGLKDCIFRFPILGPIEESVEIFHSARELLLQLSQGKTGDLVLFPEIENIQS